MASRTLFTSELKMLVMVLNVIIDVVLEGVMSVLLLVVIV